MHVDADVLNALDPCVPEALVWWNGFAKQEMHLLVPGLRTARGQRVAIATGTCFVVRALPRKGRERVASVEALPGGGRSFN